MHPLTPILAGLLVLLVIQLIKHKSQN